MNDSKNLILAVVLSALVLLGWTWAANKYFPTANPPSTKVENGQAAAAAAAPGAAVAGDAEGAAERCRRAGVGAARRDPHALADGSINLKGAQIDDLLLVTPAPDHRQEFAAGAAAVAARRARRLYRAVRLDRGGRSAPDARHGVDGRQPVADARPAGHAEHASGRRRALSDQDRGRRRLSVHRQAERHECVRQAGRSCARSASSAARPSPPIPTAGRTTSARSSVFDGKADYDVNWKTLDKDGGKAFTTSAAGSASPTNIG